MRNATPSSSTPAPVLVALGLDDRSSACLAQGCEMAVKFGQPLLVVHVVHETAESAGMYRRHHKANDTMPLSEIARDMLAEQVAAFRRERRDLDRVCEVQLAVVGGLPETRIPELASFYGASMIVMSNHSRRGLRHWLHGSITESVVRQAPCPVVVVGPNQAPIPLYDVHRPKVSEAAAEGV
jgi:nucleotide-binding universal stress UspA family protein